MAHQYLKQFSSAIDDFSTAIEISESQLGQQYDLGSNLGILLNNRGQAYCESGLTSRGLEDHFKALELCQSSGELRDRDHENHLIALQNNIGLDFNNQEDFTNALLHLNVALGLLHGEAMTRDLSYSNLGATVALNLSDTYRGLNDVKMSEIECDNCIRILESLDRTDREPLDVMLARALFSRADTYIKGLKYKNALADFERLIPLVYALAANGHPELGDLFANALAGRASVKAKIDNNIGAAEDYKQSLFVFKMLMDAHRRDIEDDYAKTLSNRGVLYSQLGDSKNALIDFTESLRLWTNYIAPEHMRATNGIAVCLLNRSFALIGVHDFTNALNDSQNAEAIVASFNYTQPDKLELLSMTHLSRAFAYDQMGMITNAINEYSRLYDLSRNLTISKCGLRDKLGMAWYNCGNNYRRVGELTNSLVFYSRSIEALDSTDHQLSSYTNELLQVLKNRCGTYIVVGEITNAINDCEKYQALALNNLDKCNCLALLGLLLAMDKQNARAVNCFEQIIKTGGSPSVIGCATLCLAQLRTNSLPLEFSAELRKRFSQSLTQ